MPWLPLYADEEDFKTIHEHLNQSDEIAYLLPDGSRFFRARWRAVRSLPRMDSARLCLWHVPSGALPLVSRLLSKEPGTIRDPWAGWTGMRDGNYANCPFF